MLTKTEARPIGVEQDPVRPEHEEAIRASERLKCIQILEELHEEQTDKIVATLEEAVRLLGEEHGSVVDCAIVRGACHVCDFLHTVKGGQL